MEKPSFRLDERCYPDDQLIPTNTSCRRRTEFLEAVRGRRTLYYRVGLDSIDSVLPLLCIGHVSQAYLLLFQAVEVCLKGMLDELKAGTLAEWMKRNPELSRNLADNPGNSEDSLKGALIDVERQTFTGAFRAASPLVVFDTALSDRASELNGVRNEIAHRGGDKERVPYYLDLIVSTAFPLLDQFFRKVLRLDLADFILHRVARELVVIAKYYRQSKQDGKALGRCLSLLHSAYFSIWELSERGVPQYDEKGWSKFNPLADDYIEWEDQCRSSVKYDIGHIVGNEPRRHSVGGGIRQSPGTTYCRICDQRCFVTSNWEKRESDEGLSFDVQEVKCPYCHLSIDDPLLAEIHYGRINRKMLGDSAWRSTLRELGLDDTQ